MCWQVVLFKDLLSASAEGRTAAGWLPCVVIAAHLGSPEKAYRRRAASGNQMIGNQNWRLVLDAYDNITEPKAPKTRVH